MYITNSKTTKEIEDSWYAKKRKRVKDFKKRVGKGKQIGSKGKQGRY
jgi:hypothetical protein